MKITSIITGLCLAVAANAWSLTFNGVGDQYVRVSGTKDVSCKNLREDYTAKTETIHWDPATDFYPDPIKFSVFEDKNCRGKSFTSTSTGKHTMRPTRRFRSYKLN